MAKRVFWGAFCTCSVAIAANSNAPRVFLKKFASRGKSLPPKPDSGGLDSQGFFLSIPLRLEFASNLAGLAN